MDCVVDDVLGDAVTDTTQPKRNFAHALGRIMDRVKPRGPDTNLQSQDAPGRGLSERESKGPAGWGTAATATASSGTCVDHAQACPSWLLPPEQIAAGQTQKAPGINLLFLGIGRSSSKL